MYAKIWPLALFSALAGEATSFGETLPLILMLVGHTNIKKYLQFRMQPFQIVLLNFEATDNLS